MNSTELRKSFLNFFEKKGHIIVPSSSLLSDDPSVLLTTAGMQQFKPYFIGLKDAAEDFGSKNTTSIQKSFRTSDIEEVGDESHLTFFEMLGNFSFGGYFKKEAIEYAHEFITKDLGLKISYVTIFEGNDKVPRDEASKDIWKNIDSSIEIREAGVEDNFWGPTGLEGPCGPTTEIYVKNPNGQDIEIWNLVFNEYYKSKTGALNNLDTPGVDTGMGLERLAMVLQKTSTVFDTDLFARIMGKISGTLSERERRIVADHVRAVGFLISDGVRPENKGAGYILRRLVRRLIVIGEPFEALCDQLVATYEETYPSLNYLDIISVYNDEKNKFEQSLKKGMKIISEKENISAQDAFDLYQTYGIPYEVLKEQPQAAFTKEEFDKLFSGHQEVSRAGAEQKFKGGLADTSEEVVKLHTATHLMNAALRKVLGNSVWQKGSNITPERTRFDFTHGEKMTDEQILKVEELVNSWIKNDLKVKREEMSREEAEKQGAIGVFGEKYPDIVSVYSISDPKTGETISREFCGGPHVENTGILGTFKIKKEESSSAGVRRIKATLF